MAEIRIPFNKPYMTGKELHNIADAHLNHHLSGDGPFTNKCHTWLEESAGAYRALLTHSCTAALEMSALLLNIGLGDEIIMPSYTFVSTANAFVLRGGTPVFVDIRKDTFNIDERLIEDAISERTRAIVVVHYAGVACNMDEILRIAKLYDIPVVEDAAQGILSKYRGRPVGGIGSLGAMSFHETKNVISGEGGALLVNDQTLLKNAEIIREKGTDRSQFIRGEVDKYTWKSVGSSFLPGEIVAAFLFAQLEEAKSITQERLRLWGIYHSGLKTLETDGLICRPSVPSECEHNAHMYYITLHESVDRGLLIERLREDGIGAVFHYVPLHLSSAGKQYCRNSGQLMNTEDLSKRILRLPLWIGISQEEQELIMDRLASTILECV